MMEWMEAEIFDLGNFLRGLVKFKGISHFKTMLCRI